MKPFSMNLSRFKKIAQDHISTTLKDPDGHEIKIVHSRLPAIQRKQLEGLPTAFAEGGEAKSPDDSSDPNQKPVTVNVNGPTPSSPVAQMAQAPINAQVGPTSENTNLVSPDQTINAPATVGLEQKAVREQQAVDEAKGAQAVNIQQGAIKAQAAIAQQDQDRIKELAQSRDETKAALQSGMINPNHYQESLGAGQKVLNALALFAGGFGGGSNPAMEYLNRQVDRDVDAQKQNQGARKSIYDMYHQQYGDANVASAMAKASLLDIQAQQMQQVAAQLATPQAKAAADAFAADRAAKANQFMLDASGRLGTLNTGQTLGSTEPAPAPAAQSTAAEPEKLWYQKAPAEAFHDMASNALGLNNSTSTQASVNKSPQDYYESHILAPNAIQHFKNLAYTPKAKEDLAAIQSQLNQATQAEKGLQDIDGTFSKLNAETNSISGRIHRGINPHAVAAIGAGIGAIPGSIIPGAGTAAGAALGAGAGEGVGHVIQAMTNTESNRAYDSDKTALLGYVSAALKGTNIGSGQIQEIVDANSPESGDGPQTVQKKLKNIKDFIINHTDTSLLKTWGLSRR